MKHFLTLHKSRGKNLLATKSENLWKFELCYTKTTFAEHFPVIRKKRTKLEIAAFLPKAPEQAMKKIDLPGAIFVFQISKARAPGYQGKKSANQTQAPFGTDNQ